MLDLILIIDVLLLVYGGGKLREAGSDLGSLVKGARRALRGVAGDRPTPPSAAAKLPDAEFPETAGDAGRDAGRKAP